MATTLKQVLAGVGTVKASRTRDMSAVEIASAAYAPAMKAQMQSIMESFSNMVGDINKVLPDIMCEALEPTLDLAKEYCPKDTGALVDSGYIEKLSAQGESNVVIGFAKNGDPAYAAIVHERVDLKHAYPTRSKFLLAAVSEDMANIWGRLQIACNIGS